MRIEKCECECLEVSTSLQLSSSNETSPKFDPTSSATEGQQVKLTQGLQQLKASLSDTLEEDCQRNLSRRFKKKTMSFSSAPEIQKEGTFI